MRQQKGIFSNIDWVLVLMYFVLVILGWFNIYAAVYNEEFQSIFDLTQQYGKQFLWIMLAMVVILAIIILDGRVYESLAYPIYIVGLLSVAGVLVFGKEINGARSWYSLGSFSLQPSEFVKFTTSLALAKFLSHRDTNLKKLKDQIIALVIVFTPALIILPQPDPGSFLVYLVFILVMFRFGLSSVYLYLGFGFLAIFLLTIGLGQIPVLIGIGALGALAIVLQRKSKRKMIRSGVFMVMALLSTLAVQFVFDTVLEDRHRNRINIMLGKLEDPHGVGYNTNQSLIAIGSGGFSGKGYLQGTQTKFNFVPEQSTDFIFCTVGEEWGFLGSILVVGLFVFLITRIVTTAERQRSAFSTVYGYCVAGIFFVHFTVNISMTIGLGPVIGIPLPFFSYGGSSLWGFTLLYFVFVKLDAYRMQILR